MSDIEVELEAQEDEEESPANLLVDAIQSVNVATVLRCSSSDFLVRVRLRISNQNRWKHMLTFILREENRSKEAWQLHVCQHYLLHNDRLVYTWEFILQSNELVVAVHDLCRMFDLIRSNLSLFDEKEKVMRPKPPKTTNRAVSRIFGELEEYPLHAPHDRNKPNSKGKGAMGINVS